MKHEKIINILKDLWCFEKSEKYTTEEIREALSFSIKALLFVENVIKISESMDYPEYKEEDLHKLVCEWEEDKNVK